MEFYNVKNKRNKNIINQVVLVIIIFTIPSIHCTNRFLAYTLAYIFDSAVYRETYT